VIFHSYVSLPEGNIDLENQPFEETFPGKTMFFLSDLC
jgi:hypothetical protein